MSDDNQSAPTPAIPSPAALAARMSTKAPAAPAAPPSASAAFGRVGEDSTVYVVIDGEDHPVGSYPGASPEEALAYFTRKYDEMAATAALLAARVSLPDVPAKEITDALAQLRESVAAGKAVGDIRALEATLDDVEKAVEAKRETELADRAKAKEEATAAREELVAKVEAIAAQPPGSTNWKASGETLRELLQQWKDAQRHGPRIDKPVEAELWKRFSAARTTFDKGRRAFFADLDQSRAQTIATKEALVERAEELSTSTDWRSTPREFKNLMDQWRSAGRASKAEDDALWQRFRDAQDAFFTAKDAVVAEEEKSYSENLAVKEALLVEAEALLPVKDLAKATASLRTIQDKWDAAGKVPRGDMERIEKRLKRVETAIRGESENKWKKSDPEMAARAASMVGQLEASVAELEATIAAATSSGDAKAAKDATDRLATQQLWLDQARKNLAEFGG